MVAPRHAVMTRVRLSRPGFRVLLLLLCSVPFAFPGCSPDMRRSAAPLSNESKELREPDAIRYGENGSRFMKRGAFEEAIGEWKKALLLYEDERDPESRLRVLVKLSQAYQSVGQLGDALESLEQALILSKTLEASSLEALVSGHMGNVYLGLGALDEAEDHLQKGLSGARASGDLELEATFLNNLGNLRVAEETYGPAWEAYAAGMEKAQRGNHLSIASVAGVNGGMALIRRGSYREAEILFRRTGSLLSGLEAGYSRAYGLINLGLGYRALGAKLPHRRTEMQSRAFESFRQALVTASKCRDHRTASYAFGYLGALYEEEKRYEEALDLTRRAMFAAQQASAPESLYRWHWQAGRIFERQNRKDEAIGAFRNALSSLQTIREEMSGCYANPEASFRKVAGSVCFDLVDLLLRKASAVDDPVAAGSCLAEARETVELLKAYELRDYFRDDCVDAFTTPAVGLDEIAKTAVVIYPILLKHRMEILVTLPSGLKQVTLQIDEASVKQEVMALRKLLVKRTTREFLPHAQRIYRWLIGPLEPDLDALDVDTLVFVPDGPLRMIPMASLHDGKSFLIEKFALAITPGLDLTDPRPIEREGVEVLALGLTRPVQGFGSLPYVTDEMRALDRMFPCTRLVNEAFRLPNLEQALKERPFNIVHVASHGQFGGELRDTFLLAYDDRVTMDRLSRLIGVFRFRDKPLDLLTLSACETAVGDERAALGLAGIAVKAGARSALASLWHINDQATSILISDFYRQVGRLSNTRAMALRHAQLKLLHDPRYEHPGYWSPFLLINNWL